MARKRFQTPRLRKVTNLGYSEDYTERPVQFFSGEAQSLLDHYNFGSAALHKIGVNLRKMGVAEEKVEEIERVVYEVILAPLQNDLTAEIDRLKHQFGEPRVDLKYGKPFIDIAQIQYPEAVFLLQLLETFDQLQVRLDQLRHTLVMKAGEHYRLTTEFRTRLKETVKKIAQMADDAIKSAHQLREDAEVEAGIKAMSASAGSTETPQDTTKASGRRGRKAADTVAPALDTKDEGQEKGPENPLMASAEERAISPFEQIQ